MPNWFYRFTHHSEFGPIGSSELLDLIRRGEIDGETDVRKDDSQWVKANTINGLWQAAGRPTVVFHCPHCEAPIDKPPTWCRKCRKDVVKAVGQLIKHSKPHDRHNTWEPTKSKTSTSSSKPKAPPLQ